MKISIIIPVLNEELSISRSLQELPSSVEVVVVDGGSSDQTVEIAKRYAKVFFGVSGRARQMNFGVGRASGDVFLFLHADTILPKKFDQFIIRKINSGCVGGGFYQTFFPNSFWLAFSSFVRNLKVTFARLFYGDQNIFVRRDVFEKLGGFKDVPILEDLYFCKALRRQGKVAVITKKVVTSSRIYQRIGFFRVWWLYRKILWWVRRGEALEDIDYRKKQYLSRLKT